MGEVIDIIGLLLPLLTMVYIGFAFTKEAGNEPIREPPQMPSSFPYFGHLLGLFWCRNQYYTKLG